MARRSLLAAVLASALAMLSIGSAAAHECIVSSRSAQGDEAAATNSKVWDKLYLTTILGQFLGLTPAQVAWAMDNRGDLPEFWVIRVDKTIGAGSSNANLADGTGLDHLIQLVGQDVFALAAEARAAMP